MQLFSLSYSTADTLVALEHDICVWGGAVNTLLFCCVPYCFVLPASVCMCVSGVC